MNPLLTESRASGKWLRSLVEEPVVVEIYGGRVFSGVVDEYESNRLYFYDMAELKSGKWITLDQGYSVHRSGISRLVRLSNDLILASTYKMVFGKETKDRPRLRIDEVRNMYLEPGYRPPVGIACNLNGGCHSHACDGELHDALRALAKFDAPQAEKDAFKTVRARLIRLGAKIP